MSKAISNEQAAEKLYGKSNITKPSAPLQHKKVTQQQTKRTTAPRKGTQAESK